MITVNRRALVDDQYDSACALTDTINAHGNPPSDSASSLLRDVYQGLLARAGESDMDTVGPCRVVVSPWTLPCVTGDITPLNAR